MTTLSTVSADSVLDLFMEYSEGLPSPAIFRKWAALSMVAGAVERRVKIRVMDFDLFPNLWVLLVAGPGIGKSTIISPVGELWATTGKLSVAPSKITGAALIDEMLDSSRPQKTGEIHHPLNIAASEFGVLVPGHDLAFLNQLNDLYDCKKLFEARTRTGGIKKIEYPHINLLSGTQPKYLAEILPETAYGMGFTSRMLMIYSGEQVYVPLFKKRESSAMLYKAISKRLARLSDISGDFTVDDEAGAVLEAWHINGQEPVPSHSRLQSYNPRRVTHLLKLSMVFSLTRSESLIIGEADVRDAMDTLFEAEALMPEIFKDMSHGSDKEVIDEAFQFLWMQYSKTKKPIRENLLIHFLSRHVPVMKIQFIIETMVSAKMITSDGLPSGQRNFKPITKQLHGVGE